MEFRYDRKRVGVAVVALAACLALSSLASAAYVTVGPGMFAPLGNPVNIGMGEPAVRLSLRPMDLSVRNNSWSLADIDQYIDKEIPQEVRDRFVDAISGDSLALNMSTISTVDLGVSVFSANFSIRSNTTAGLAKDVIELAFHGNELNRRYVLDNSAAGTAIYGDASVGLSFGLGGAVRVGGRYHRLMGAGYASGKLSGGGEIIFTDDDTGWDGDLTLEYLHSFGGGVRGEGSAFDVGVSVQVTPTLAVGFAMLDMGQIAWKDVTHAVYEGSLETGTEPSFTLIEETTLATMDWQLPRRYEASVGLQLTNTVHLGASYTSTVHNPTQGFTQSAGGQALAMLSWNGLGILPVGVGASYSPDDGLSLAGEAGLRLGPIRSRARVTDIQGLLGQGNAKGLGFTIDMGIVF